MYSIVVGYVVPTVVVQKQKYKRRRRNQTELLRRFYNPQKPSRTKAVSSKKQLGSSVKISATSNARILVEKLRKQGALIQVVWKISSVSLFSQKFSLV